MLILLLFCFVFFCLSSCEYRFIQSISYGSVTNIDSFFALLVFHLFFCISIFNAYCFLFSILTILDLSWSIIIFSFVHCGSSILRSYYIMNSPNLAVAVIAVSYTHAIKTMNSPKLVVLILILVEVSYTHTIQLLIHFKKNQMKVFPSLRRWSRSSVIFFCFLEHLSSTTDCAIKYNFFSFNSELFFSKFGCPLRLDIAVFHLFFPPVIIK